MAAVATLPDRFARVGLTVLRGAGLRIGELLDLELDCVVDYGPAGQWLRVPLGKLNSERSIPLDEATLAALDEWIDPPRHPTGAAAPARRPDGRLPVRRARPPPGREPDPHGLPQAVRAAGLTGADGAAAAVVPHQLRHTYATALANAGMSLQGLMALLGHTTPEMTLRYATLASPTLRAAYEKRWARCAPSYPIAPVGKPLIPDRVEWLRAEMLKTRVAHGYCARELPPGLPLRQHLRDLRQLRHRPRVRPRAASRPARRRPAPPRRRPPPAAGTSRGRPPRAGHPSPERAPHPTHPLTSRNAPRLDPATRAG